MIDGSAIRETLRYGEVQTRRALRQVSTADRGQTVENQLQPLQEAAGRLGWTVVAIYRDDGISGARGRDKRPGLDAMLKGSPVASSMSCQHARPADWVDHCQT